MKPADRLMPALVASMALVFHASSADAVTVTVAKACARSLAKAFPPREPGNPAAGSAAGSSEDQRKFYAKCVADGGPKSDSSK